MIYDGLKYKAVIGNIGAVVTRKSDGADVFMQGDDANEIASQMDALDAASERGYPQGPFSSYAEHIAYETVMVTK